jgi:hypothetical protein
MVAIAPGLSAALQDRYRLDRGRTSRQCGGPAQGRRSLTAEYALRTVLFLADHGGGLRISHCRARDGIILPAL